jgi:hypothetical protein
MIKVGHNGGQAKTYRIGPIRLVQNSLKNEDQDIANHRIEQTHRQKSPELQSSHSLIP